MSSKDKDKFDQAKIDRLQLDKFTLGKKLKEEMLTRQALEKRLDYLESEFLKQNKRLNLIEKPLDKMPYKTKGKVIETYWCYFLIGSNRGYDTTTLITEEELLKHITNFQNKYWKESCSVNVAPNNTIVFQDYKEMCYKVEAINYPRFPKTERDIYEFMLTLMEYLLVNLDQQRITLVTPHKSVMLENTQLIDELAIKAESKD